jgi:hypothetical protein
VPGAFCRNLAKSSPPRIGYNFFGLVECRNGCLNTAGSTIDLVTIAITGSNVLWGLGAMNNDGLVIIPSGAAKAVPTLRIAGFQLFGSSTAILEIPSNAAPDTGNSTFSAANMDANCGATPCTYKRGTAAVQNFGP